MKYRGERVWHYPDQSDGKENVFWHLTSRKPEPIPRRKRKFHPSGRNEDDRLPDPRRCERLRWVRAVIEHADDPEVLNWDYEEDDGKIHTYLWLRNDDFAVILEKRADQTHRLITSFCIDTPYKREDFERKYANRLKK